MCHNMSTSYVYSYTMHVSPVQAPEVDSTYLTSFEMNLTLTKHSSSNRQKCTLLEVSLMRKYVILTFSVLFTNLMLELVPNWHE